MNILIVIDSLASGGAQRVQISLAISLINRGHTVEFFTYKKGQFFKAILKSNNINIYSTQKEENGFSVSTLKRLRGIIISNGYDVIISSMHAPSIYAALAMIGIKNGKLIVCEESSSNAPTPILRKIIFYLASLSAHSVVTKSFDEAKLLSRWPGLSHKIHTIWNGIEITPFPNGQNIVNNKVLKLIIVARIAYPKNGVNLLRALSLFHDRNGWTPKVDWAGRRDNDKRSIEMQRQMDHFLLDHPEIASSWTWLGEVNNVDKLYLESDALILVSIYEGVPTVIIEAMTKGCFVIASNICDNPLIIANEERGLLCDPLSPESICNSLERLSVMSFSEKNNIIKNAREFAELSFNQGNMARAYEPLF